MLVDEEREDGQADEGEDAEEQPASTAEKRGNSSPETFLDGNVGVLRALRGIGDQGIGAPLQRTQSQYRRLCETDQIYVLYR